MKRRTWMWMVLGGAGVGIALAFITNRYIRPEKTDDVAAATAKIKAVVDKVKRKLDAGAQKPSPEDVKEVQEVAALGPDGQNTAGALCLAWLQRMHDRKSVEDIAEFNELATFLLSVDPAVAKSCVEAMRKVQNPADKPFEMRLLATFGKPGVVAVMTALEEDARKAGDDYWLAARSPYPQALAKLVPEALPAARSAAQHEDPRIRRQALRALALMGLEGRERVVDTVPDVEAALKDRDKSVRLFAALALGELAPPSYTTAAALVNLLDDPDYHVRLAAARTLGSLRGVDLQHVAQVVAALLKGEPFKNTWWNVVGQPPTLAAYAAWKGGDDYSTLFWEEATAHVLLGLGPRHRLPPETIVELLRSCRHDGRHLITLLAAQGVRAVSVVPELAKMAKDPDFPQRRKALLALGRFGKAVPDDTLPDVVAAVSGALDHRDGKTRWLAFMALVQLDPAAARAKWPASLHPAINELSGRLTDLKGVSHWTRCLWHGSAAVLVPATNASADVDPLGLYRTPIDWDIFFENERLDNMLAALGRAGSLGKDAVPYLLDVWQGTDRDEVSNVLVKIGPAGLPPLTKDLEDPGQQDMHLKILGVLQAMGPKAKPAVGSLVKALADTNEDVCQKAARTLGLLGPDAKEAVPGLRKLLKGKNTDARRHAADALGLIGAEAKPALPDLIGLFQNDNQQLRVVAVRATSRIGKDAVEPLTEALKSQREAVRLSAVRALALLKEETISALAVLRELAQNDPSTEVRTEAGELVKKLEAK